MKRKFVVSIIVISLMTMLVSGLTLSLFSDTESKAQNFATGKIDIDVTDTVTPPTGNTPGMKIIKVRNKSGTNDAYVRVKLIGTWQEDTGGGVYKDTALDISNVSYRLNDASKTDWEYSGTDGFFYYRTPLAKGTSSPDLKVDIVFSTPLDSQYSGKKFKVAVFAEGVQAGYGASEALWNKSF